MCSSSRRPILAQLFTLCSILGFASSSVSATDGGEAFLVKNINRQISPDGSDPDDLRAAGDRAYFLAEGNTLGTSIWSTDGTAEGTRLALDPWPAHRYHVQTMWGTQSSRLFYFRGDYFESEYGLRLVDLVTGRDEELVSWSSADFVNHAPSIRPLGVLESAEVFVFTVRNLVEGEEPWASDGTPEGTYRLADLNPGEGDALSNRYRAYWLDDAVVFWAYAPGIGVELWRTDGTPAGTTLLKEIVPGPASGLPETDVHNLDRFVAHGEDLVFLANDGESGDEVWITDGTAGGTRRLTDFRPGLTIDGLTADYGGGSIYVATSTAGADQIWTIDPSTGEHLLREFQGLGTISFSAGAEPFFDGRFYFIADDGEHGDELWVTDGTTAGTQRVGDFCSGPCGSDFRTVASSNDNFFFFLNGDGQAGLFALDRNSEDPVFLAPIDPPRRVALLRPDLLVFFTSEPIRPRLWRSDGTAGGTYPLAPSGRDLLGDHDFPQLTALGGLAVVAADDGTTGVEPWVTDGTIEGTRLLVNIMGNDEAGSRPEQLTRIGEEVFFVASERSGEPSVWQTDGTPAGTRPLEAGLALPTDGEPYDELVLGTGGDLLYVFGRSGRRGDFVLRSIDSVSGEVVLLGTTGAPQNPSRFERTNGLDLFFAGGKLHRVDLATRAREVVAQISSSALDPEERVFVRMGGDLFFAGMTTGGGGRLEGLWRTDGTATGTEVVTRQRAAGNPEAPVDIGWLTSTGDRVYFAGTSFRHGRELFVSDGTKDGTEVLFDLRPGAEHSDPRHLAWDGEALWFAADDSEGPAVWRWREGLQQPQMVLPPSMAGEVVDIETTGGRVFVALAGGELWAAPISGGVPTPVAPPSTDPSSLDIVGSRVVFDGFSPDRGRELWSSDGTPSGTGPVTDVAPGPFSSATTGGVTRLDDLLLFSAADGRTGQELWALPVETLDDAEPPDAEEPPPPDDGWLTTQEIPDFRFRVKIVTPDGTSSLGRAEPDCLPETLCVSGALPGRSEVFLRVVGPKPNGYLWPTVVKFTTSEVRVEVHQISSGTGQTYRLEGARPGIDELPGLFDRHGFRP